MSDEPDEFIPIRKACKMVGLRYKSTKSFLKDVKIKSFTTPAGQTLYSRQSLLAYINDHTSFSEELPKKVKHNIIYCRVSSKKQEDDLKRQIDMARSNYPGYEIISDIGSGINWERIGLQTILELSVQKAIKELVVFHRDRLSRFGFDLVEKIIKLSGGKITVVDSSPEKSTEQELTEDLMSLIHIYSCRQMGKRRYSERKKVSQDQKDKTL